MAPANTSNKRAGRSPAGPLSRGPVVVPLDGSEPSERALKFAVALALAWDEQVVLVAVATHRNQGGLAGLAPSIKLEFEESGVQQAEGYLREVRNRLRRTVQAEAIVRIGDPAREVQAAARKLKARLIVMTTHGRSGVSRWVQGSVAGTLLRESTIPLLAIGPNVPKPDPRKLRLKHILVPLDGGEAAEAALPVARQLAGDLGGRISVVRVVQWMADYSYRTQAAVYDPNLDKVLEQGAATYVERQLQALTGIDAQAFIRRGSTSTRLLDFVTRQKIDLVVMTTHARRGVARAALGSIADRMIHGKAPVLLLRPSR